MRRSFHSLEVGKVATLWSGSLWAERRPARQSEAGADALSVTIGSLLCAASGADLSAICCAGRERVREGTERTGDLPSRNHHLRKSQHRPVTWREKHCGR